MAVTKVVGYPWTLPPTVTKEDELRRFVSLGLLGLSVLLLAVGIVQRTVLAPPSTHTESIIFDQPASLTLLDSSDVNTISRKQFYSVTGGAEGLVYSDPSDTTSTLIEASSTRVVVAYGRTPDVMAWIDGATYQRVSLVPETGALQSTVIVGTDARVPDPAQSDMWESVVVSDQYLETSVILPDDYTLVIATDGQLPAPASFSLTWQIPVDITVPTAFISAGLGVGAIGIAMYLWALFQDRRRRRHRQGRMPRAPRGPRWRPRSVFPAMPRGQRVRKFVVALALVPAVMSGCSSPGATVTPTPVESTEPIEMPYVAVTEKQFERIIASAAKTMAEADETRDENLAATRLAGAALKFRSIAYRLRAASPDLGDFFTIPSGPVRLVLPQQTEAWPRSVFAIVDDADNPDSPSVALTLVQDSPRDNYKITYAVSLEPSVVIPEVASAQLGAAQLAPDTDLLAKSPMAVINEYGDVIINGTDSQFAASFAADTLQEQVGAAAKAARATELGASAKFSWKEDVGSFAPFVLATSDAGALVAMTFVESETVRPKQQGSAISTSGAVKVLSGKSNSVTGVTAQYEYQVLFYVPQIGSAEPVRLLGYSYSLVRAFALPNS